MLRSRFILSSFAFAALALAACGGTTDTTGEGGSGGGTGGAGGAGGEAPAGDPKKPPKAGPETPGDGPGVTLAIRKLYLGDTDRDGKPSTSAWEDFGYDLDNKISTATSKDLCKPAAGAKGADVYPDGTDGIDNSFGANIMTLITTLAPDASTQINDSIEGGAFTILLKMEDMGTGDSYNPLLTKLYGGAKLVDANGMEVAPKWDGSDQWPVFSELLNGGNIDDPKVQFPKSYVVKDEQTGARTWVSGTSGEIALNLSIQGFSLALTIGQAVISAEVPSDNKSATNGTIAGIINTEQLISELAKVAGSFSPDLCPPSATFESLAQQIRQASDILTSGSQDPSKECDGISIGLGFEMSAVELGAVAPPAEPGEDPCAAM